MIYRKLIGIWIKYSSLVGLLAFNIFSLYNAATTITDKMDRNIYIWTNVLAISAVVGEIGSLLVLDRFNILATGKTSNFVQDIWEESSQDVAVMYNGLFGSSLLISMIFILYLIYTFTGNRIFSNVVVALFTVMSIGTIIYIFAVYLKVKHMHPQSIFTNISTSATLPAIICLIQILITQKAWVGYIYHIVCKPTNDVLLALGLILILVYFLASSFCHFSNLYCLIGFVFIKRDIYRIQGKIDRIQEKEEEQEALLRQATKDIDEASEQGDFIGIVKLFFSFNILHVKVYVKGRIYAALYLLSLLKFRITKCFSGLLQPDRIKINSIRFCLAVAVLELLSLNLILFIYLNSDSPCLKFFELLSTVIIIPILLSWLAGLGFKNE